MRFYITARKREKVTIHQMKRGREVAFTREQDTLLHTGDKYPSRADAQRDADALRREPGIIDVQVGEHRRMPRKGRASTVRRGGYNSDRGIRPSRAFVTDQRM